MTNMTGDNPLEPPQRTRRLGQSGIEVGPIAYGCWRFAGVDTAVARARIETAVEHGMTLIDTADIYGLDTAGGFGSAESLLGAVLAEAPALRERIVLATKGGIDPGVPYDSSPAYLRAACEASLRRLGVEVIDLYQIHRPDLLAHPEDVASALTALFDTGKVRALGVSNYAPRQIAALRHFLGEVPLVTTQPEFSLVHLDPLDDGTLDLAMRDGLTPLAWSPLGGGRLGGTAPGAGANGSGGDQLQGTLDALAARESVSSAAIALAWVMAHPSRPIPIIGTGRPERITEAAAALDVRLSRADWYSLTAAAGRPLP